MARDPAPLFLERSSYRRRRMMDAIKLIVVLGVCLWMIPVLWPVGDPQSIEALPMSRALFYIFGVWLVLIGLSAILVKRLRSANVAQDDFGSGS